MPNMILPFFSGVILTKIGNHRGLLAYALVVTIGQYICTAGGYWNSFNILILGRIIYGLGGETLQVIQAVYVANWFKDQEISMAMGIS